MVTVFMYSAGGFAGSADTLMVCVAPLARVPEAGDIPRPPGPEML